MAAIDVYTAISAIITAPVRTWQQDDGTGNDGLDDRHRRAATVCSFSTCPVRWTCLPRRMCRPASMPIGCRWSPAARPDPQFVRRAADARTRHRSSRMPEPIDTLLVAGSPHAAGPARWPVVDWLRRTAARRAALWIGVQRRVLAGGGRSARRSAGHHPLGGRRPDRERFPAGHARVDAIHVRDGKLRTAAGVTAGLDLALALVEEDLGAERSRGGSRRSSSCSSSAGRPDAVQPQGRRQPWPAGPRCRRCSVGWPPIRRATIASRSLPAHAA